MGTPVFGQSRDRDSGMGNSMSENRVKHAANRVILVPMSPDRDTSYSALLSRDPRFDGRIFVGVSTTGIYCRPVCPVRKPKKENCRFFPSAAAAETDGFRPCLRCRPEEAPGNASVDRVARLASIAAHAIEEEGTVDRSMERLAGSLGVSDRHLRRVFSETFGVSPGRYAQTQKLLLARRLLAGSDLSVLDVAMTAGFGSVRRLNELFRDRYKTTPTAIRRSSGNPHPVALVFELGFRPPYAWEAILDFLGNRALKGVEDVAGNAYRRSVLVPNERILHSGWLSVERPAGKNVLRLTLSGSLAPVVSRVLGRVRRLFDIECRPDVVRIALGPLGDREPGLRVPGVFDGFEMAVRAVLGQQISVRGARTLAGRLIEAFGEPVDTPYPEISRTFPRPERIAALDPRDLAGIGIFGSRVRAILGLASARACGTIALSPVPDVDKEMQTLRSLHGIGEWTAQYIAMRAMAWPDAFPHTDHGIMKALNERSPRRVLEIAEHWRPWRAYAAMALWRSLEETT